LIEKFYNNLEKIVEERTAELNMANMTISHLAATDELTNLKNRRSFNDCLTASLSAAHRHEYPLSMIMTDLDNFKSVNDTCGHCEGDKVLQAFADVLREMIRNEDIAARWGGEEFIIILPHTARIDAAALAERIRAAFEKLSVSSNMIVLSASFGVVQLHNSEDADSLIRRADDALYQAKHEGRNRVIMA
jgi:diguanylate cyclase (GGDEF)-like protein